MEKYQQGSFIGLCGMHLREILIMKELKDNLSKCILKSMIELFRKFGLMGRQIDMSVEWLLTELMESEDRSVKI